MQKEKEEKNRNRLRTTSKFRKDIERRKRNRSLQRRRNQRKQTTSNVHLFATDYINSLNSLKIHHTYNEGIFSEKNDVIQMIKDLYPVIKNKLGAISGEEHFCNELEPIDFLYWLLRQYQNSKAYDDNWTIDYVKDEDRYRIIYLYDYDDIGEKGRSQSLDFLLIVKKNNIKLYQLFLDYLYLVDKAIHLPFWFTNSNLDYHLDYIEQCYHEFHVDDPEEAKRYEECLVEYKGENGRAKSLELDIRAAKTTKKQFKEDLKNIKGKNKKERMIIDFMINHIGLINKKKTSLFDHWHLGRQEEGNPVSFEDYASLMFSYDEDDLFFNHIEEVYQMNAQEYGVAPFRYIMEDGKDKKQPQLPYLYINMLDDLGKIIYKYS